MFTHGPCVGPVVVTIDWSIHTSLCLYPQGRTPVVPRPSSVVGPPVIIRGRKMTEEKAEGGFQGLKSVNTTDNFSV